MQWRIFMESERRSPAPPFRLLSSQGKPFALDDQRGWSNLVLFFTHGLDCPVCRAALQELAARRAEYDAVEARVVAILPAFPAEVPTSTYPFPVLADATGSARRAYTDLIGQVAESHAGAAAARPPVLVVVIDRYGTPYAAAALDEPDDPDLQPGVLEWLDFVELQCPE